MITTYPGAVSGLSDPPGSSTLVAAILWLQGTVLGVIATTVAVIAVSWVGMLMLAGRIEIRRGLTALFGCFVLLGASAIAGGIEAALDGKGMLRPSLPPAVPLRLPTPPIPNNPDPYAGASLPTR